MYTRRKLNVFFFFDVIGKLSENKIIRKAFDKVCFSKLRAEGYSDMNPIIGRPRISKKEMEINLRKINSPITPLFCESYPKGKDEIEEKILSFLDELMAETEAFDEYTYFALVYYIFQGIGSLEEKMICIQELYESWSQNENRNINIKIADGVVYDENRIEANFITSIETYMKFLGEISRGNTKIFFRGHSKASYLLQPSIFRKKEWKENEKKMYQELMIKCPQEFALMNTHIEKLAEMQHYGLPTRLLDITQNPLVALHFACETDESYKGEVIIFNENRERIKYPQSDKVAILSSLPLFSYDEQKTFYEFSTQDLEKVDFNKKVERLVHEVRLERPGFQSMIKSEDIRDVVVCIPAKKNRRIDNQEGAFMVCGLLQEEYGGQGEGSFSKLRVRNSDGRMVVCIIDNKKKYWNN